MRFFFVLILFQLNVSAFSQCLGFQFAEIGYEPANCRTASYQTGNGVVYAAATGGTEPYSYQWTNLQTGQTTNNTTWGGLNVGEYKIVATDSQGCMLTEILKVDSVLPKADFELFQVEIDSSLEGFYAAEVVFVNTSKHCGDWVVIEWDSPEFAWNFNNSPEWTTAYLNENFTAQITQPGFYEVCLSAHNNNECMDTLCKSISIAPALFENEFAQFFYSSVTGVVSVEWLLDEQGYFTLFDFNGAGTFEIPLTSGSNLFSVEPGMYFYQLISTSVGLVLSGTLVVGG